MTDRQQAEANVREKCRTSCRALLCERNERCMALLYDTPGFYNWVMRELGGPLWFWKH